MTHIVIRAIIPFSIFGNPATDAIWGWRLEGHHLSFNFSSENNLLVSGTPCFLAPTRLLYYRVLKKESIF
jgi:hypothetical protein